MGYRETPVPTAMPSRKPGDDEIDLYGLTHPGRVRSDNQDHFLICSLRKQLVVHMSSLPEAAELLGGSQRVALLMMVADGVGGRAKGAEASRLALEGVSRYVSRSMRCYYAGDASNDEVFSAELQRAAMDCHAELRRRGESSPEYRGMATTLTLYLGVWPRAYLLQVGDSRCYLLRHDRLTQITRDQTMAQELIDLGVLTRADASGSRFAHTLSSAIGGQQTAPAVTRIELDWDTSILLCSDGLPRHVSDERIRERLLAAGSAREACEGLLQDALDGGGSDNISIIIRRIRRRDEPQEASFAGT